MKKKRVYIKPESTIIIVQMDNLMQHISGAEVTSDNETEEIEVEDGVPDDWGWEKQDNLW
ncbi:MAG: hypothetical protein KHX42_05560 [Prevotella sp.]|nr:hypothetical protein [Prevotella sp.]